MNQNQRRVLALAAVLFAAIGFFPPFVITCTFPSRPEVPPVVTQHHFDLLAWPPEQESAYGMTWTHRLDVAQLALRWAVLAAVTAALLLAFRRPAPAPASAAAPRPTEPSPPVPAPPASGAIQAPRS